MLVSATARLLLSVLPQPFFTFSYSDLVAAAYTQPVLEAHWPYFAYPFYYQPLLGWSVALLSYVVPDRLLLVLALNMVAAAAAGGVAALLVRRVGTRRTLLYWSCAPQLLLFGGANVDTLPVLFVVAATAALLARRTFSTGVALGLGAAAKVFPIVALPPFALGLWRSSRRDAIRAIAAALAVLALLDVPALLARYSLLSFGVGAYVSQPWNDDSIWLPVSLVLAAVAGPATERLIVVGSFLGAAATYAILVLRPALRGGDPARLGWIAVVVLLLWTRLYSVQYAIWLLPVFALFVPRVVPFALMTAGDVLVYVAVFGRTAAGLQLGDPAAVPFIIAMMAGVVVRHAALVLLLIAARRSQTVTVAAVDRSTLVT